MIRILFTAGIGVAVLVRMVGALLRRAGGG